MLSWRRYFRPQDLVWLLLFSALAIFSPERGPVVPPLLVGLGVVKVLERRIGPVVSIAVELGFCYALIYYGGAISSEFYPILFLPVISAATNFGLRGVVLSTIAASVVYLSYLSFIDWETTYIDRQAFFELSLRVLWFPLVGFLTYQLAKASREKALKLELAAKELAEANKNLQEAQAAVRRSERLAALGQLTAGLAHELRNPLGTMKTSAELLARQVAPENEIAKEMAGFITAEVDRTNSLITRFLDFAKPQRLKLQSGDIARMLDQAVERFEREKSGAAASITVQKNYARDLPAIAFDAELLERALLNLLINAAQASPPGAEVTASARRMEAASGPGVEISIADRGSGIDQKNLESIFNPFFTTKSDGVGLGLAIVSKIIDEHGGRIFVESAPGEGAVFRIFLPSAEAPDRNI